MTKSDDNNEYAAIAYDGTNAVPLKVDAVTGRLLIAISISADSTPVLNSAQIDDNKEGVSLVIDDNGSVKPLLIDNRNGYLFVDLLEE